MSKSGALLIRALVALIAVLLIVACPSPTGGGGGDGGGDVGGDGGGDGGGGDPGGPFVVGSVTDSRLETTWTLDGPSMTYSRAKLLDPTNFGPGGTVAYTITIGDVAGAVGSIDASLLSRFNIFSSGGSTTFIPRPSLSTNSTPW